MPPQYQVGIKASNSDRQRVEQLGNKNDEKARQNFLEALARSCSVKKVFLEIPQNSQEKGNSGTAVSL